MRSLIHDSLKEMKGLGVRLVEIEHIRHNMRKESALKEAFQEFDRRHQTELAYGKTLRRNLILGLLVVSLLVDAGMFNGVAALTSFKNDGTVSPVGIINALCSIVLLYLGKRQVIC
jgi:hypothetical protein